MSLLWMHRLRGSFFLLALLSGSCERHSVPCSGTRAQVSIPCFQWNAVIASQANKGLVCSFRMQDLSRTFPVSLPARSVHLYLRMARDSEGETPNDSAGDSAPQRADKIRDDWGLSSDYWSDNDDPQRPRKGSKQSLGHSCVVRCVWNLC